jgi:hypothetical protein
MRICVAAIPDASARFIFGRDRLISAIQCRAVTENADSRRLSELLQMRGTGNSGLPKQILRIKGIAG